MLKRYPSTRRQAPPGLCTGHPFSVLLGLFWRPAWWFRLRRFHLLVLLRRRRSLKRGIYYWLRGALAIITMHSGIFLAGLPGPRRGALNAGNAQPVRHIRRFGTAIPAALGRPALCLSGTFCRPLHLGAQRWFPAFFDAVPAGAGARMVLLPASLLAAFPGGTLRPKQSRRHTHHAQDRWPGHTFGWRST